MENKIIKVKKKFYYEGIELRIVEREEPYLSSKEPFIATRVVAPNGGMIPYHIQRNETLKDIANNIVDLLNSFAKRGADVKNELTRELEL